MPRLRALHLLLGGLVCLQCISATAQPVPTAPGGDRSLKQEVQRAIDRGVAWLLTAQNTNSHWSTADHPAVTALALTAIVGEPSGRYQHAPPPAVRRGYEFLLACAKPDGGIYQTNLANYNTSVSLLALLAAQRADYEPAMRRARAYLVRSQIDLGEKGRLDSPFDGGVGYGSKYDHSDLNNTLLALEALHRTRHLVKDKNLADAPELDWPAAIHFLQNCQNLPGHNHESWASDDPKNKGGFIYYPGHSFAGTETNAAGRVAFRSYGSASYAGLLSYIYAELKPADPRVRAVLDWLRANYTLEENPGMGQQGLFYYLHLLTKGLAAADIDELELKNGRRVRWRTDVALKLINLQQRDGSWSNENGRWWEKDSVLVTAYSVLALEIIQHGL